MPKRTTMTDQIYDYLCSVVRFGIIDPPVFRQALG